MKNIPLSKPTYSQKVKDELIKVLDSGWTGNGPKVKEFETKFAEYVGAKYAVATNSCTSALDLVIKAYGIKGGELITTPMTFVSDAIVGEWNGMDVTFADIDERTLCIDPKSIKVTEKTKVVIAVDSHGRLADIDGIRKACGEYKPLIIEDAAHACYTQGAGTGDVTVWSFQAVKTLPIFDGGMITTNDENLVKELKRRYWVGVEKSTFDRVGQKGYTWQYDITQADSIKGYMTDIQAVIGLHQLDRLKEMNAKRRAIAAAYNEAFKNIKGFVAPEYSETVQYYTPSWENRDGLCEFMAQNGVHTSVHFQPLSETTYWKKANKNGLPITDKVWKKLLSLPVHDSMTDEDVDYIIGLVKKFYE